MINYIYECSTCKMQHRIRHSIKSPPLTRCPSCKTDTLFRVIHAATVIDATPKTLGGFADQQSRLMGHCELQERRENADKPKKKKKKAPWRSKVPIQKLAAMTPEQKEKYVMTGKS
jgi:putative FmdB family regulatory protein